MDDKNLVRNIKILVIFFSLCFFSIIVYLTYFYTNTANKIIGDPSNRRLRIEEAEILRGSIVDRDGEKIVYSKRISEEKQKRIYNNPYVFAHVTGYNSYAFGKTGVEKAYNSLLQGKSEGYNILGTIFKTLRETLQKDEKRGNDVYLTIDSKLQKAAYNAFGNNKGAAVAINPETGEILAMVSKPSFNPQFISEDNSEKFQKYNQDTENVPLLNRAVQGYYPPGSTFKIITSAAALENIPNIEEQEFNCTGKLKIGNYILTDHNNMSHGRLDIKKAFMVSCNYTFGTIGMEIGSTNLVRTAENFLFNKSIETRDEFPVFSIKTGKIRVEDENDKSLIAQDAIGQHDVSTNPLHMALVASAIANGGTIMKPYIVKRVKDRYGVTVYETEPSVLKKALNDSVAEKIQEYMISTVEKGTGKKVKLKGITVGGKTGSAENAEGKEPHSWFVSFGNSSGKKIAIAVIVENGGIGGGKAADITRQILRAYFNR